MNYIKFSETYKCLNKNKFSKGEFKIIPLRYEDRMDIMNWRNEQMYHLRQDRKLTEESQECYFKNTIATLFDQENPNQILFSYFKNDEFIGYGGLVHINWVDKNGEISFIMNTCLEETEFEIHWSNFLHLITIVAFESLNFKKIFTYAYDLRPHLYAVLENNGFNLKSKLIDEINIDSSNIDVIIYEKENPYYLITIRKCVKDDIRLIYDWSNDQTVRKQSFSQEPIIYSEHENWFNKKLQNKNSIFLINEYCNTPAGLVRFDIQKSNTTIGILIDLTYRRKGLSSIMLIKSVSNYFEIFDKPILAFIKKSNQSSIKAFVKAEFEFFDFTVVNEIPTVVYKLEKK